MIELLYILIGVVAGSLVTHLLDRRLLKKKWKKEEGEKVDMILSSLDLEVKNNLTIAKENQKKSSQGTSTAQRRDYSYFNFSAYDHFSKSVTTPIKEQIGAEALNHLVSGYKQCRKFNQVFKEYRDGKKISSRSDLQNFNKIIIEFETYLKLRKSE